MFKRDLFTEDHEAFRDTVRRFIEQEIAPHHARWEEEGVVPRDLWLKAGAAGLLCCTVAEQYGGAGADYLFDVVVFEEMARSGYTGPGLAQAQACMGSITPAAYKAALGALVQFEQRAALPSITVPTLCIAGEHDRTAAPSVVQRMADKIPKAQYQCLGGVGHLLTFEQPEAFAGAVLDFLNRSFR